MEKEPDVISGRGFLGALTSAEAADLEQVGRRRRFTRGATIFIEGDPSSHVVILLSGLAKVVSVSPGGREVVLALRGPGELLGEISLIDDSPRNATVSAVEDGDGLLVAGPAFLDFLERHPRVCITLMRTLSGRLREADRKHVEFAASDTVGRVARRLLDLSVPLGRRSADGLHVALPVSQDELASWVGASREAVSKALRVMRTRGWIEVRRRDVVLMDEPALRRRAT